MNTFRHIQPRRTVDELLLLQARARQERFVAFCILVTAVVGIVGLAVWGILQ